MTKWQSFNEQSRPRPGLYAVRIEGDSEYVDGMEGYSYPAYDTFAHISYDADDCLVFKAEHNEEASWCSAIYGPLDIPTCDI